MQYPKKKPYESEEYVDFIKKQPCCVHVSRCKAMDRLRDGHHLKTKGSGGGDLERIPLCRPLHTEVHMSRGKFEEKYHIDLKDVQINCLKLYIEEKLS
jgi:hypothetical protein